MVSTRGRKPARTPIDARTLTRIDLAEIEPDITFAVACRISGFGPEKSISGIRHCDLALIVSITLDCAVEALQVEEVAA